jgi:transcriptional regulator with XRE-family HTH domain
VDASTPAPAAQRNAASVFGAQLRAWRACRGLSQLELAARSEVSQRHLSFLESGRALPSRSMVLLLSRCLALPLRECNQLLLAAGFAPQYPERPLEDAGMVAVSQALEATLRHHEPYPAFVLNRRWDMVMGNAAADRIVALLGPPDQVWQRVDPEGGRNLMRLTLHPLGLQPLIENWAQTAETLLSRLDHEVRANPANAALRALIDSLQTLPGVPARAAPDVDDAVPPPVLSLKLRHGPWRLEIFSMICSFGTALDVTADELRLELLFPANAATADFFRGAGAGSC